MVVVMPRMILAGLRYRVQEGRFVDGSGWLPECWGLLIFRHPIAGLCACAPATQAGVTGLHQVLIIGCCV